MFDSPQEAQEFCHDPDVYGLGSLEYQGIDGMLLVDLRRLPSFGFRFDCFKMGLNTFPRTSVGVCGVLLCNGFLRFLGLLLLCSFLRRWIILRLASRFDWFPLFSWGSDFCWSKDGFEGRSDRRFWFRRRTCFRFAGFDMELSFFACGPFSTNRI